MFTDKQGERNDRQQGGCGTVCPQHHGQLVDKPAHGTHQPAAGFLASGYLLLCEQHELPGGFCKISCAALITLVCILACRVLGTPASHSIIGSLMILTPGIAFTMGIRDFVHGDYLSGTIRMIDALLIAASIAIGTGLVLSLYTFFTGVVVA